MDSVQEAAFEITLASLFAGPNDVHFPRRTQYGKGIEARAVRRELGEFRYESSPTYAAIIRHFGLSLSLQELRGIVLSIKDLLEHECGLKLPPMTRNTKRTKALLIKYMHENQNYFLPMLQNVTLCDRDANPIAIHREHLPEPILGPILPQLSANQVNRK